MQKQRTNQLVQIGGALLAVGIVLMILLKFATLLGPFAGFLVIAGLILLIIGLVTPGKS